MTNVSWVPDSPNPDGPHEHLYWAHHLERARATAALWPPQPPITIACVICRAGDTLEDQKSERHPPGS